MSLNVILIIVGAVALVVTVGGALAILASLGNRHHRKSKPRSRKD